MNSSVKDMVSRNASAQDISKMLRGRPGLIIGQSKTLALSSSNSISESLATAYDLHSASSIYDLHPSLSELGIKDSEIRSRLESIVASSQSGSLLTTIAKVNWSAILSLSMDRNFEIELQHQSLESPSRHDISTIHDFKSVLPPGTVPSFKLLDVVGHDRIPITEAELLRRIAHWRYALSNFSDLVQGNPVFVFGVVGQEELFLKLVAETFAESKYQISRFVFLDSDATSNLSGLPDLVGNDSQIYSVNATLGQLVEAAVSAEKTNYHLQRQLEFADDEVGVRETLQKHNEIVFDVAVARQLCCEEHDHNLIVERLFSPDSLNWDAFIYDYDFRRDTEKGLTEQIYNSDNNTSAAYYLGGGVASGKTTVLKRTALELVKRNLVVLWVKTHISDTSQKAINGLFADLKKLQKQNNLKIVVIVDDPFSFGMLQPRDFVFSAKKHNVNFQLVVGMRSSDSQLNANADLIGDLPLDGTFEIPNDLTDDEWKTLPEFLVKLHIADDIADARQQCRNAESRASRDTLGVLYWLLPNVRNDLKGAIKQQFFRIGNYATVKNIVIGGYELSLIHI